MTRNDLYEAAFRYKKAGLWKKLWDNEVFAVKLQSGEIGYISIMGKNGEYCALGLYLGEEGFRSYRKLANMGRYNGSAFADHEMLLQQKCLHLAFDNKEGLMPEEVEEVRTYAKENGIKLTGKNAFPQFIKYEPNYHPWKVQDAHDIDTLCEAAEAATLLAAELSLVNKASMGIESIDPYTEEVPLFIVDGDRLKPYGFAPLPGDAEDVYDPVLMKNDIALAKVKKLPQKGVWESELVRLMQPVQNSPEETPYYPLMLLLVENQSYYLLPVPIEMEYEKHPENMLNELAEAWKKQGCCAKEIRCRDARTYALLKDFCEKTSCKVSIYEKEMAALDDAEYHLQRQMGGPDVDASDQMAEIIEMILSLPRSELKNMPASLLEQLRQMLVMGIFPDDLARELANKLKGI